MARSICTLSRHLAQGMAFTLVALTPLAAQAQDAGTATTAAAASTRELGVEARIPFVSMGSIRNWRADSDHTLYVQDQRRNWYRANLVGPCNDLAFAERIGFETRGTNQLDRFAAVIVGGQRCAFNSFVTSAPPPTREELLRQREQQRQQGAPRSN